MTDWHTRQAREQAQQLDQVASRYLARAMAAEANVTALRAKLASVNRAMQDALDNLMNEQTGSYAASILSAELAAWSSGVGRG